MFSLLGRRYPYLGAVVGAVLFVIGIALHGARFEVIGAVVLAAGGHPQHRRLAEGRPYRRQRWPAVRPMSSAVVEHAAKHDGGVAAIQDVSFAVPPRQVTTPPGLAGGAEVARGMVALLPEDRKTADGDLPPAIELNGVHKVFGSVQAVNGIDLTVWPGEIVAFLGPNGAGKTSIIDVILGLAQPTSGRVSIYGMRPRQAISRGLVSAVMQTGGLLKDLTVAETARYTASLFAHAHPVEHALKRAGIAAVADRKVGKCSGGEQQRLRFAMALLSDPELLILDEPTTGMDVEGRRSFWAAIRHDCAQGRTVLFATHYLEEADAYADRIILLRHGHVVADGTAAEVKALAAGRTVRATLAGADQAALRAIPGADSIEVRGETVLIHSSDSDAVAKYLLTATAARDLDITTRGLEDAFITLTSDDNDRPGNYTGAAR
jgi:ABC-2 type transport system ATP-binding protein